jgi:cellulose synthase/poly-beta-1,6-N-acetylglucosamine synthase-like glycosyltransferase
LIDFLSWFFNCCLKTRAAELTYVLWRQTQHFNAGFVKRLRYNSTTVPFFAVEFMMKIAVIVVLVLYSAAMLFIFLYSLSQAHLLWSYLRKKTGIKAKAGDELTVLPKVTIQLPVYNEKYVVERLIDAVCGMNYPRHLLEIQLLDDSTDDSFEKAMGKIQEWQLKGIDIKQIKRPERTGFKAGALRYGLEAASGEFIAIFDADFVPEPEFLNKVIPHFSNDRVGLVQTRWEHLNRNHSLLTKVQSLALDAHFTIEQTGRSKLGTFINFNGTAGVWRRQTIIDAGNWQDDTLTEDLDLSYRAQLKGWQFIYLEDVLSPAELPMVMSAVKGQQYRWNKGGAEVARKMLGNIWRSKSSLLKKMHGSFHLLNSAIFIAIIVSALLSVPLVWVKASYPLFKTWIMAGTFTLVSFIIIGLTYFVANRQRFSSGLKSSVTYFLYFPVFLSVSMGLSLHNAVAVLQGYAGKKTPFIRTPKFNITEGSDGWKKNKYLSAGSGGILMLEILLAVYFAGAVFLDFYLHDLALLPFHIMLLLGFGAVVGYTVRQRVEKS